jgi:2'-5' RNA ligase
VGFTDEVSTEEITELLEELQQRCASFPSVEMTVGSPIVAEEGVVLEVDPLDDARKLRHRVRTVLTEVRDPNKLDGGDAYTPHLTLAYSNSEGPAARVIERLDPLPSLPAKLTFNRLSLVSLGRDNQMYEWDVIGCVPLSG